MIVEDQYREQLLNIFDENNQKYISDRNAVKRGFLNVVYVEDNIALGYAVVYLKNDFCQKEDFPIAIDNIKDNSIYIWQMATKKGFQNRGIGTKIIEYLTEKFRDRDIYSVIDITNFGSMKIHKKCGFIEIQKFDKKYNGKNNHFILMLKEMN